MTQEQELLSHLYDLEESLNEILIKQDMFEEIQVLKSIIKKLEYNIINHQFGSWGI